MHSLFKLFYPNTLLYNIDNPYTPILRFHPLFFFKILNLCFLFLLPMLPTYTSSISLSYQGYEVKLSSFSSRFLCFRPLSSKLLFKFEFEFEMASTFLNIPHFQSHSFSILLLYLFPKQNQTQNYLG